MFLSCKEPCSPTARLAEATRKISCLWNVDLIRPWSDCWDWAFHNRTHRWSDMFTRGVENTHAGCQSFTRVDQSLPELSRVDQSWAELSRVDQSWPELTRVEQSWAELTRVDQVTITTHMLVAHISCHYGYIWLDWLWKWVRGMPIECSCPGCPRCLLFALCRYTVTWGLQEEGGLCSKGGRMALQTSTGPGRNTRWYILHKRALTKEICSKWRHPTDSLFMHLSSCVLRCNS